MIYKKGDIITNIFKPTYVIEITGAEPDPARYHYKFLSAVGSSMFRVGETGTAASSTFENLNSYRPYTKLDKVIK